MFVRSLDLNTGWLRWRLRATCFNTDRPFPHTHHNLWGHKLVIPPNHVAAFLNAELRHEVANFLEKKSLFPYLSG